MVGGAWRLGPEPTENRADAINGELAVSKERVVSLLEITERAPKSLHLLEHGCVGDLEPREGLGLRFKLLAGSREGRSDNDIFGL